MTALEMLKGLKRNKSHMLWLNADRREAAYHDGICAVPVDYNDAALVRPDPGIVVVEKRDGEVLAGAA